MYQNYPLAFKIIHNLEEKLNPEYECICEKVN